MGPAVHAAVPPHDCGTAPAEIRLAYELVLSAEPLPEVVEPEASPLRIPRTFSWLTYNTGEPISMGWRLSATPRVATAPCGCGPAP